jgi:hypothetical protein
MFVVCGVEPATSCVVGEYSDHYANSAINNSENNTAMSKKLVKPETKMIWTINDMDHSHEQSQKRFFKKKYWILENCLTFSKDGHNMINQKCNLQLIHASEDNLSR